MLWKRTASIEFRAIDQKLCGKCALGNLVKLRSMKINLKTSNIIKKNPFTKQNAPGIPRFPQKNVFYD